ncbi:histidine phosphatase superfamily-domain-containing protein [Auriculariales sp. MPI-PUGE-AT-0066]|nr:histidine phosphatase superfamily-domain-containing protein [Auriculariales sp. MPI-PUGE-AT-0066]
MNSRLQSPARKSRGTSTDHLPRSASSFSMRNGSPSPDGYSTNPVTPGKRAVLGVCAMDVKARSRAMREILTRVVLLGDGAIDVKIFGDKVILDEDVQAWPRCDILVSFYSTDFPLDKACEYVKLRKPLCVNGLLLQELLWDRRLVGAVLDHLNIPTPLRFEVSRDGGPKVSNDLRKAVFDKIGLVLGGERRTPSIQLREDGDAIIIDGKVLEKPFVEKPVSGEDHNIWIYFRGGTGRKLFRKVGNKSSELVPNLNEFRTDGSYIYEQFIDVFTAEDIKVYTIGETFTHAETRKSPVVDGVVRRNTEGKEVRYLTQLSDEEKAYAARICQGFGQRICGFDVVRTAGSEHSMVIDVNGWSFVKGNEAYYDKAADYLASLCFQARGARAEPEAAAVEPEESTWKLKANVTGKSVYAGYDMQTDGSAVFRHADRTPKQKLKYNFPVAEPWTQPFVRILNGEREEIILREREQLQRIVDAVEESKSLGATGEDLGKLQQLSTALFNKIDLPGTKAQLKPAYKRVQGMAARQLVKLQLVFKWGGEFTHAARYQSRDLGENMKKDISIMNKDVLNNVKIYTSSERRVTASAEIFAAALMETKSSRSARTSEVLSGPSTGASSPISISGFNVQIAAAPKVQLIIRKDLLDDSNAAKDLTDEVKKRLKILLRPGESERRPELAWPKDEKEPAEVVKEVIELLRSFREIMHRNYERMDAEASHERWCCDDEPFLFRERWEKLFEEFCDVKQEKFDPSRVSELYDTIKYCALHHRAFLFRIFNPDGAKNPEPSQDRQLHQLYHRAKLLFDLVAPQEYGIEDIDKEEIGVLTSLPLLRKIVEDLEAARMNEQSNLTLYFTKESHIYTLANLLLNSGLPFVTRRIPELDYCSHFTFELYERNGGPDKSQDKEYTIKLSFSPGAHSSNVLDSSLDARHSLNVQPKQNLTHHLSYSEVIEKLSKHFSRVPLLDDDASGDEDIISLIPASFSTTGTSDGLIPGSPSPEAITAS